MGFYRLWFWSAINPVPRIIAHGKGQTIRGAMAGMFAPVEDTTWEQTIEDGEVYLRRRGSGYCGQEVVEGEPARIPHTGVIRPRIFLQPDPKPMNKLEDKPARKRLHL
jgi:hypothetical protein